MAEAAARAEELIRTEIKPAQQAYVDTLQGLLAKARTSLSCSGTNDGRDYYRAMVRHFTTSDLTPEAVHELGLAEVTRIGEAIEAVASEAGYMGDVPGYRRFLATDAQFVAPLGRHPARANGKLVQAHRPADPEVLRPHSTHDLRPRIDSGERLGGDAARLCTTEPGRQLGIGGVLDQRPARQVSRATSTCPSPCTRPGRDT